MTETARLPLIDGGAVTAPVVLAGDLERAAPEEPLFDYVLERYPAGKAADDGLRSVNALYAAAAIAGRERAIRAMTERVRGALGPGRTVWGIKHADEAGGFTGVELYFYDWRRERADLSIERVVELLSPFVRVDAREPRALPWHMVSVELPWDALEARGATAGGDLPAHVYVDMRSYALQGDRLRFENVYTFHDPALEIDDLVRRIEASVYVDARAVGLGALLPPALMQCHKVCFANKRDGDALYFSRVPLLDVLPTLRARRWPPGFVAWLEREAGRLGHLRWDVGIDFTAGSGGRPRLRRSGLYGFF